MNFESYFDSNEQDHDDLMKQEFGLGGNRFILRDESFELVRQLGVEVREQITQYMRDKGIDANQITDNELIVLLDHYSKIIDGPSHLSLTDLRQVNSGTATATYSALAAISLVTGTNSKVLIDRARSKLQDNEFDCDE